MVDPEAAAFLRTMIGSSMARCNLYRVNDAKHRRNGRNNSTDLALPLARLKTPLTVEK